MAKVSGSLGGEERLSNRDLGKLVSEGRENLGSMAGMLSKLAAFSLSLGRAFFFDLEVRTVLCLEPTEGHFFVLK